MATESIKEELANIAKKVISERALAKKPEENYSEFEEEEEDIEVDIEEIVDEIIEFVYLAAAEGQFEFEVGKYIQKFGGRNYDKIAGRLKEKLYDVMVLKWTTRTNLKVYWGKSEA